MIEASTNNLCRNCGAEGYGNFCTSCGETFKVTAITFASLIHQVFNFFTHYDKGFAYTVKSLAKYPGSMQVKYIEGFRSKHQKPFSFFFLCGTICGLAFYFINVANRKLNDNIDLSEEDFFRHYFILIQAVMMPVYALILWSFFKRSKFNYAEIMVMMMYNLGFVFLVFIPINTLKLIPGYDSKYLELIFLSIYNPLTNIRFFSSSSKGIVIIKTLICMSICYVIAQLISEFAQSLLH